MKVKIFVNTGDAKRLERELNDWLENNKSISINYIEQSSAYAGESMSFLISIWYFENL